MSEIFVKTLDFGGEDTYHPLPIVDMDDNDKVLMVVDGKWAVADNDGGSGQYLWKQYRIITYPDLTMTVLSSEGAATVIQVASDDVDLSTVDSSYFIGYSGNLPSGGAEHIITFTTATDVYILWGGTNNLYTTFTYDSSTAQITIANAWSGTPTDTFVRASTDLEFSGYVTAKRVDKYPNDDIQDDYYYSLCSTIDDMCTWADGTDEQIVHMVELADAGLINLSDYWSVGDERTVTLAAMEATGVGESHPAESVTMVLMNAGGKTLTTATASGRTTCSFIVGLKNSLATTGYMNSAPTNIGGWSSSARRAWCNSVFRNAIPSTLREIFKQHKNITIVTYDGATNETTDDYFALPAEKEIFGSATRSNSTEAAALSQFKWYETASNRLKKDGDDSIAYYWWERSLSTGGSNVFCCVYTDGSANHNAASGAIGISPFGVI